MEKVNFTPVGIALKQHELYGMDDSMLMLEAKKLEEDIIGWSLENFDLDNKQIQWLHEQGDDFKRKFAKTVSDGFIGRYDFNILFTGPSDPWKSKKVSAKQEMGIKVINIFVERIP